MTQHVHTVIVELHRGWFVDMRVICIVTTFSTMQWRNMWIPSLLIGSAGASLTRVSSALWPILVKCNDTACAYRHCGLAAQVLCEHAGRHLLFGHISVMQSLTRGSFHMIQLDKRVLVLASVSCALLICWIQFNTTIKSTFYLLFWHAKALKTLYKMLTLFISKRLL